VFFFFWFCFLFFCFFLHMASLAAAREDELPLDVCDNTVGEKIRFLSPHDPLHDECVSFVTEDADPASRIISRGFDEDGDDELLDASVSGLDGQKIQVTPPAVVSVTAKSSGLSILSDPSESLLPAPDPDAAEQQQLQADLKMEH
jgi:hypothetical protein